MNKKLIVIDADGTIRRSDHLISEMTVKIIKKIKEHQFVVIICTGRPRYQAIEIMNDAKADQIVISSNGAEIFDYKKNITLKSDFIEKLSVIRIVGLAYKYNVRLILTSDNIEYVTKDVRTKSQFLVDRKNYEEQFSKINIKQCMYIDKKSDKLDAIKKEIADIYDVRVIEEIKQSSTGEKWFNVISSITSKGNALIYLANYLKIDLDDTIAIGNDVNDISMFDVSGLSVAVDNSPKEVKEHADIVIPSNDLDGVALFLETILSKNV